MCVYMKSVEIRRSDTLNIWTYPKFKILSFGRDESEVGSSSNWLLNKFRISRLDRFAKPGGTPEIIIFMIGNIVVRVVEMRE